MRILELTGIDKRVIKFLKGSYVSMENQINSPYFDQHYSYWRNPNQVGVKLTPIIICLVLMPLTQILNNIRIGSKSTCGTEANRILYQHDLKIFGQSFKQIKSLITKQDFRSDIKVEYLLDKCCGLAHR